MEEKKLDINSIIGFVLIFGILLYIMYQNQPTPEEIEAQKQAEQERVEAEQKASKQNATLVTTAEDYSNTQSLDSVQRVALQNKLGVFSYALSQPSNSKITEVETDVLNLKFNNTGGHLKEVKLKNFVDFDSVPIYMVKDQNSSFNISFGTTDNRTFNTQDLPFQSSVVKSGENTVVSMKLKVSDAQFLEYRYEIRPNSPWVLYKKKKTAMDKKNVALDLNIDKRHSSTSANATECSNREYCLSHSLSRAFCLSLCLCLSLFLP